MEEEDLLRLRQAHRSLWSGIKKGRRGGCGGGQADEGGCKGRVGGGQGDEGGCTGGAAHERGKWPDLFVKTLFSSVLEMANALKSDSAWAG